MESTSRPSVFSRLGFDNGHQQQGGKRVEEERVRGEGGEGRRRRREKERRSDEGRRRGEFDSGRRGGEGRWGERDLGVNRRGSPIKKVQMMLI